MTLRPLTFVVVDMANPHSTKMLPNYRWLMPPAANIFTSKDAKGVVVEGVVYAISILFGVYRARGYQGVINPMLRSGLFDSLFWDQRSMSRESC